MRADLIDSAERALVGALLVDPSKIDRVRLAVSPEDFTSDHGRLAMIAILNAHDAGKATDIAAVARLTGGECNAYLAKCIGQGLPQSVDSYAAEIRQNALSRVLRAIGDSFVDRLSSCDTSDSVGLAEWMVQKLENALAGTGTDTAKPIQEFATDAMASIAESMHRREHLGAATGLVELDLSIGGLFPGELTTCAARPGIGKTSLLLQVCRQVAKSARVVVFSLEMTGQELAQRKLCSIAEVSNSRVRSGATTQGEYERLAEAAASLDGLDLIIDDSAEMTIHKIAAISRMLATEKPLGLIGVDYIGLVRPSAVASKRSRTEQVSEVTKGLKALAKQLNCPVLALSQVNREAAKEGWLKLHHLSESGSIEQDSNSVWFIQKSVEKVRDEEVTRVFIDVAKNRNGQTGCVEVRWEPQFTRFSSTGADAMGNYEQEFAEWGTNE